MIITKYIFLILTSLARGYMVNFTISKSGSNKSQSIAQHRERESHQARANKLWWRLSKWHKGNKCNDDNFANFSTLLIIPTMQLTFPCSHLGKNCVREWVMRWGFGCSHISFLRLHTSSYTLLCIIINFPIFMIHNYYGCVVIHKWIQHMRRYIVLCAMVSTIRQRSNSHIHLQQRQLVIYI